MRLGPWASGAPRAGCAAALAVALSALGPAPVQAQVPPPQTASASEQSPERAAARPAAAGVPLAADALDAQGRLRLHHLLEKTLQAHPTVQAARLEMRASTEDRRAAERLRWPALTALVENRSSNQSVVASRVMRVEQTLWDAGRINARIEETGRLIDANQARVQVTTQQLSLQVVAAWQNLLAADGRIGVIQETLAQLGRYQAQMERRVQAEASPPIDLELVRSRVLQAEVELDQATNTRRQALSRLEQLSGIAGLMRHPWSAPAFPEPSLTQSQAQQVLQADWAEVARRHPAVERARQEEQAARQRLEAKRAEQYPQLYMRVDRPIGAVNNDIAGFVGLRYTPGAGLATSVEARALSERAAGLEQAIETALREITETLQADREDFQSSLSRTLALQKAVEGSRAVLESYGRQFTAGRKTWLDLLNAVRELAQNQTALVDSRSTMLGALHRLQVRMEAPIQPAP